jgi:hypothetical protein
MKLRKLEWWEAPKAKAPKPSLTVVPLHTKETVREEVVRTEQVPVNLPDLESLKKEVESLKKRRPEYVSGSGSVGSYHQVTSNEMRFTKHSFQPGLNVIGVASGVPTTIWLPADLEPNHLVAVKDELGVAAQLPITVQVYT